MCVPGHPDMSDDRPWRAYVEFYNSQKSEHEARMRLGRKRFLSGTILATVATLTSCSKSATRDKNQASAFYYPVLTPQEYDYEGMMATLQLSNPHKQVFLGTGVGVQTEGPLHYVRMLFKPDVSDLFIHMQLAMNGYDFSLGQKGKLATLGVLTGDAVILGLNDQMWRTYNLGWHFNLHHTNVFYKAKSTLDPNVSPNDPYGLYQDFSAQAILKRGGSFMVCHNALTSLANKVSRDCKSAVTEMSKNLLPGFMLVPAGVTAVQLAQEYGWKIY